MQQFVPEVVTHGEQSLVFIEGRFSHAVRKQPRRGDFRTQSQYGAAVRACEPAQEILELARRTLQIAGAECAYARVNVVQTASGPLLMELELIEPQLLLGHATDTAARLVAALSTRAEAAVACWATARAAADRLSPGLATPLRSS